MRRFVILLALVACKGDAKKKTEPLPKESNAEPWPTDAPSATACKVDDDCVIVAVAPASESPCCDFTVTALPTAKAFVEHMAKWRAKHCPKPECPPMELPGAQLAACGYTPKCIDSQCANACN